ncbi:uncharacterized protein LY89DRAFT_670662 [Mollisia scopiformis]|uniref:Uncharacterized protein n=1 Tax=Mollisia scopiformis TaxID=149040 RepID=A0A194X4Q2_MOLSC|nr:uncharacterized protein LY89DRAFT_670662 [Mollisia scopiformis]KUJ15158.1 hypothetical protein LY89DRAFT_670662 [Mollisia scopiformis]
MTETSPPPSSRRFSPTPVETTVKKIRRFAVEPVETTTRSSKKEEAPVENESTAEKKDAAPAKRRFAPEPVETTFKSNRHAANPLPTPEPTPVSIPEDSPDEETPKPRRKFVPELIETTKRSKRAGDTRPATLPTDKTDLTPGVPNIYTRPKRKVPRPPVVPIPPDNTPNSSSVNIQTIPPLPPRRQPSMRPHPNTRRSTRQNSFQPELEAIPSDSNSEENSEDEDGTPSLTGSYGSSEDSQMRLQLARTRESCDDRFSGYLLALAAKAAEKQLREQALAAFPNESMHEIVEHFYDREIEGASDEETVEGVGLLIDDPQLSVIRRKSTEVGWAAKEMQAHQEKLNRLREDETHKKVAAEATQPSFKDPFWTNGMTVKNAAFARGEEPVDAQKEAELARMRSAASPPMLGGDLKFRMCPSPKATKFETDQRMDIQPNRSDTGGGLWGGYCVADEPGVFLSPNTMKGPALIQTPRNETHSDPFSSAFASEIPGAGAKSPNKANGHAHEGGVRMLAGLDERLKAEVTRSKVEDALLQEFDDTFVTQVYNYLSLGYPSLARQYDEELARISRISELELRVDDQKKNVKGHIGLSNAHTSNGKVEKEEVHCTRWKALRFYILEWARQHPSMSNGAMGPSAWGVRARRGSWAI